MKPYTLLFYGYVLGILTITACASVQYKYYGVMLPDSCYTQGKLIGAGTKDWPDLPLSECRPDAAVAGKCIMQLEQDFFSKDKALKECQSDLISCQKGAIPKS